MNNRDKELQIITIEDDLKREKEEDNLTDIEMLDLFERFYEIEISNLEKDFNDLTPTIH